MKGVLLLFPEFECVLNTHFSLNYIYAKKLEWRNPGCKMFSISCFVVCELV